MANLVDAMRSKVQAYAGGWVRVVQGAPMARLAALAGVLLAGLSVAVLPIGLALAAGAMLYVISHEIIPQAHRQGHEGLATGGLMLGFVVMLVLDVSAV